MKERILALLSEDSFISGELLSKELHISRTAIWKHINSLIQLGYVFECKKNKGYRLISRPDIPLAEEILPKICTSIIGKQLFYFPSLSSTNNYAKKLLNNDIAEGTIIVSERQSEGRGRKSRTWFSPKEGLWFSVILYPNIPPQKAMYITMAASIAIVKAINEICDINAKIKWPNDILVNEKKICGILTELDAEMDRINYIIIGIGINVNNRIPSILINSATSLKIEIGKNVSRVDLLCSILTHFDKTYMKIINKDLESIRKSWLLYTNIIGKEIFVRGEKETIKGFASGIDKNGCLLVSSKKGIIHIVSGDIEYI